MSAIKKEIKNPPHFQIITSILALEEVCQRAREKSYVALDTEFIRTRTFYPKLGLIQLYDGEKVSLIDPLVIDDFSAFIALLADINVIKILHASKEDLEIFYHYFKQLPTPLIDTQVVSQFLGFGHSMGFASLIYHYFQLELDKGASRTDWLARPLSDVQLRYAAADVWYLLPLYEKMQQHLLQTPWQSAVQNECELLLEKISKPRDPERAYFDIPNAWKLNEQALMALKLLAKWRLEEAIKRDVALNFIVKSEHLWLVAKHLPKHTSALLDLGLLPMEVRVNGKKMLQLVEKAKRTPKEAYPSPIVRLVDEPRYRAGLKMLQQKLNEITPAELPIETISSKRGLESLMKWCWIKHQDPNDLPDLLKGWRKEFGETLLKSLQSF
ncbi:ribonuclease D [Avibacterium sp. 21-599]|uniref:ribonuclease D n=1 Tax=Avibacterium sp. 21-599 TaxID=2911528 RepID=UPI00224612E1|nr:ribonuclease D [Avibacterium sp. 21-599]MCW9718193.1 ribonuclease D [Avibacterium sp. 21-599]